MMNVSIIIPNYNARELLKKNLPKVFEAIKDYESELVVVDDGSTDKSVQEIQNSKIEMQNYSSKFKIILNDKNVGFASTVNRGVEEASGEIIVLLNTDVAPEKYFLEPLIRHFRNPNIFAVGCMDKSREGKRVVLRGRGLGGFRRGFLVHWRGEVDKNDTLWVSGGSGAFRKSIWNKLGGFDPLYNPFYWEDIDISYRALKSGYKILFEPKSIVLHEHEKGSIRRHYAKYQIKTIAYRNQLIFIWKNITDLDKQFSHIAWLPYHIVATLLRGDFHFLLGFLLAVIKLPYIILSSFQAQKLFVKRDKDILG